MIKRNAEFKCAHFLFVVVKNDEVTVDAVVLRDKDHTGACRAERTASVLGSLGVCGSEDGLFSVHQADLPDSEVEVMDCQQKIVVEG